MTRRLSNHFRPAALCALGSLLLMSGTGCLWHGGYAPGMCGPCAPTVADAGCDGCGDACAPRCDAFPGTCGDCVPGSCGGFTGLMLPLLSTRLACGSGCGDMYWGDWLSDPPSSCGPCNHDGGWGGDGACGYGCGPSCGLLAGPVAIVQGTTIGVTNLVRGTFQTLHFGLLYGVGACSGAHYGPACVDSSPAVDCDACGQSACSGDCAQAMPGTSHGPVARRSRGAIPTSWNPSRTPHATRPPHRLTTQRLRVAP